MTIIKRVTFIAKEGCEEKIRELLITMVAPSKIEDGYIFYDIFAYENNKRKFMAVESWRDNEVLDGYKTSAHYAVYKSSCEPYCEHKYSNELEVLG